MLFLRLSYTRSLAAALSETIALSRSPLCSLSLHLYSTSPLSTLCLYSMSLPRPVRPGTAAHTTSHNTLIHRYSPLSSLYTIRMLRHSTPLHYTIGYSAPLQSIGTHSLYSLSMAMYRCGGSGSGAERAPYRPL